MGLIAIIAAPPAGSKLHLQGTIVPRHEREMQVKKVMTAGDPKSRMQGAVFSATSSGPTRN